MNGKTKFVGITIILANIILLITLCLFLQHFL